MGAPMRAHSLATASITTSAKRLIVGVGASQTAAHVHDVHVVVPDICDEVGDDLRSRRIAAQLEDLGSDVAMQSAKLDARGRTTRRHGVGGRATLDRKAELGIELPGGDEGMGGRLHTRGHPDEHRLADAPARADAVEQSDLIK